MGTVTSPKEIVAVDIDLATMALIIPRSCKLIRFNQLRVPVHHYALVARPTRPKMLLGKGMLARVADAWLLYGANGYTGELIARRAAARGRAPGAGRAQRGIGRAPGRGAGPGRSACSRSTSPPPWTAAWPG